MEMPKTIEDSSKLHLAYTQSFDDKNVTFGKLLRKVCKLPKLPGPDFLPILTQPYSFSPFSTTTLIIGPTFPRETVID